MQLVASIGLIVIGLALGLFLGAPGDMRVFGWVIAGVGVFGLVVRSVIPRQPDGRRPPRQP
jgi:hypothetical protein